MSILQSKLQRALGKRDTLLQDYSKLHDYYDEIQDRYIIAESARLIGQYLTEQGRTEIKNIFEGIGTAALKAIFGETAEFHVDYRKTDSDTRQAFLRVSIGNVSGDPLTNSGNSVAAILSTLLRRAVIILDPTLRNILICDEALSGIDEGKMEDVAVIDREMVDSQGMQLITITHDGVTEYLSLADTVIEVKMVDGISQITYIKQPSGYSGMLESYEEEL